MTPHTMHRRPLWLAAVIIICALPAALLPALSSLSSLPPLSPPVASLMRLYPWYVAATSVCAWLCWPQRRDLTWILLVILLLSHAAVWYLSLTPTPSPQ